MNKILVTGGCGFIASCLIKKLLKNKSNKILNLDALKKQSVKESLDSINSNKNYNFKKIDISNFEKLHSTIVNFKPDLIYHLAAESHVDRSISAPNKFIISNFNGTLNILESLRRTKYWQKNIKFKMINVSTDEVYGSLSKQQKSFTEKNQYKPNSPYSSSKASSDLIARSYYKTFNIPIITSHCSNNYGPWQYPEKLIPVVILSCLLEKKIPIYGKGHNIRDWLYVEDHVDALIKISNSNKIGENYNIGGGKELTNLEIVNKICSIMDELVPKKYSHKKLISFVKDRLSHDFRYSVNIDKIKKELNYKPKHNFNDGLFKTVKWYVNNSNWLLNKIK